MHNTLLFTAIFVLGEVIAFFVFKTLNFFFFGRNWEFKINLSVFKGNVERLFLFLSLVYGIPHALIAFGAIKIGTRIEPDKKISNDYFFIGNIISLLISVFYFALWRFFLSI